ncbi:MAG: class I SAM-dependent methyltransferase [Solirubrobacteraceae bacterium]
MTPARTGAGTAVPTGNAFDKYGSRNAAVRRLVGSFRAAVDDLLALAGPQSLLDVGCGEGTLTESWAERMSPGRVVGIDLEDPGLRLEWDRRRRPNLEFLAASAEALPFAENEFELVAATQALEHVSDPGAVLADMTRVAQRHLLVSAPREPLWRALNMLRGAYLPQWGNTPGHLHHWSSRDLVDLLADFGDVVELRSPLPWTVALVRVL